MFRYCFQIHSRVVYIRTDELALFPEVLVGMYAII